MTGFCGRLRWRELAQEDVEFGNPALVELVRLWGVEDAEIQGGGADMDAAVRMRRENTPWKCGV